MKVIQRIISLLNSIYFRRFFYSWLKNEQGWDQFDLVFWIECRNLKTPFQKFFEEELTKTMELWKDIINMERVMKDFQICWIFDDYDKRSCFVEDFIEALKEHSYNNLFIVTSNWVHEKKINLDLTNVQISDLDFHKCI